jgi:diguanylate cyclase (GGDEF)-like protein
MADSRPLVLIADDDGVTRAMVSSWLAKSGYEVVAAKDGSEALELAAEHLPDLLLVDVTMPGLDGYDVCRAVQATGAVAPPVIFLTAHSQTTARVAGLDAGAVDYIVKPFDHAELIARVRAALRTKATRDQLAEQATRDPLTGLFNRRQLETLAGEAIAVARRYRRPLSCLMIDLDRFKQVNDRLGHAAGDEVLCEAAKRFSQVSRGADVLGRYGGEEFLAVLPQVDLAAAGAAAERLRQALEGCAVSLESGVRVAITGSFGVSSQCELSTHPTADLLVSLADRRLYEAKAAGRNCVRPHAREHGS